MTDPTSTINRQDLAALLRNVSPTFESAAQWYQYAQAMTATRVTIEQVLALQEAAVAVATDTDDGGAATKTLVAAVDTQLTTLTDGLTTTPPTFPSVFPTAVPTGSGLMWPWWWPYPFPPFWTPDGTATPPVLTTPLPAAALLACGSQLTETGVIVADFARHEPFVATFAKHEPFAVAGGRLIDAGLTALAA